MRDSFDCELRFFTERIARKRKRNEYYTWPHPVCLSVRVLARYHAWSWSTRAYDQLSDTIIGKMEIATIVDLARGCSLTHVMLWERCCVYAIFRQKHLRPKTAVTDSAYQRRPGGRAGYRACNLYIIPWPQTTSFTFSSVACISIAKREHAVIVLEWRMQV